MEKKQLKTNTSMFWKIFIKKHKNMFITFCVLSVILILVFGFINYSHNNDKTNENTYIYKYVYENISILSSKFNSFFIFISLLFALMAASISYELKYSHYFTKIRLLNGNGVILRHNNLFSYLIGFAFVLFLGMMIEIILRFGIDLKTKESLVISHVGILFTISFYVWAITLFELLKHIIKNNSKAFLWISIALTILASFMLTLITNLVMLYSKTEQSKSIISSMLYIAAVILPAYTINSHTIITSLTHVLPFFEYTFVWFIPFIVNATINISLIVLYKTRMEQYA
ncbi:hypothetical protein [Mycoplasma phocoenae]|uniref:ABC transporter permease n=1 Tax=Mycoplasma phocoenae TaxID=754517 RepID=A0A858U354_9MOLU|nr:hypothetical protein [Mycoplasma phocoenae]QJG66910.1 hypothetical protein HGG69_01040 [Mycoplasma phocoenae]